MSIINDFNEIIDLQQKLHEDRQKLKKCKKKSIKRSIHCLLMIHKTALKISQNQVLEPHSLYSYDAIVFIKQALQRNDLPFIRNVFQSLSQCYQSDILNIEPYIPYNQYMNKLIQAENKETLYHILFNDLRGYIISMLKRAFCSWKHYSFNEQQCYLSLEINMSYIIKYLPIIFNLYGNDMFNYCKNKKVAMFMFFFLFQEHFTDEMFLYFLKTMKVLKQSIYTMYVNNHTRYFPDKYKKQYQAFCSLHDLKE